MDKGFEASHQRGYTDVKEAHELTVPFPGDSAHHHSKQTP